MPKITIVGAGLAGLTAGYRLAQMGYSFEIYEARQRPGGRVRTVNVGDTYEELGGKSLRDGANGQHILALLKELGLETEIYRISFNHRFVYHNQILDTGAVFKSILPVSHIDELCERYAKTEPNLGAILDKFATNDAAKSLLSLWPRNYDGTDSHQLAAEYIYFYLPMMDRTAGSDRLVNANRSEFVATKGGNTRLIEALAQPLTSFIHYSHVLTRLAQLPDGTLSLQFKNGKEIITDYLVLALPCSTLRDVQIEANIFPADQRQAIEGLQYGTNSKILLPIKLNKPPHGLVLTDHASTWFDASASIMTMYYGGANGKLALSQLRTLFDEDLAAVKLVYPDLQLPYGSDIKFVEHDSKETRYMHPIAINWADEPFSKGSYSNYAAGQYASFTKSCEVLGEQLKCVFRPIANKIFFAGEHTDLKDPGTLEAAVVSGERVARMLGRVLKE